MYLNKEDLIKFIQDDFDDNTIFKISNVYEEVIDNNPLTNTTFGSTQAIIKGNMMIDYTKKVK